MTLPRDGAVRAAAVLRARIAQRDERGRVVPEPEVADRIRGVLLSAQYRHEREQYPEWIDLGGEG